MSATWLKKTSRIVSPLSNINNSAPIHGQKSLCGNCGIQHHTPRELRLLSVQSTLFPHMQKEVDSVCWTGLLWNSNVQTCKALGSGPSHSHKKLVEKGSSKSAYGLRYLFIPKHRAWEIYKVYLKQELTKLISNNAFPWILVGLYLSWECGTYRVVCWIQALLPPGESTIPFSIKPLYLAKANPTPISRGEPRLV